MSELEMKLPKPDSIVGLISGPSVNIWFMHSLMNLYKTDKDIRFAADWLLVYGPYIHSNRNQLQHEFMQTDRDWLFMVDNDMVFEPKDVWLLFEEAEKRGPGIYTAPYLMEDGFMVCGAWDSEAPMTYHNLGKLPSKPMEIGVAGAGFTLFHRAVFEAIGESAFSPIAENRGEDLSVSWRAREKGFTPVLVPDCNPGHFKQVTIFPHEQVRNTVGDEVNLVEINPKLDIDPEPDVRSEHNMLEEVK